ncbi:MAG: cell division protein FtsA [Mangrovibacterium sp.]
MRKEKVVAAIDVGTSKTVVMVGKLDEKGQVEVLASGKALSQGVVRGEVRNIEAVAKAIDEAVCNADIDDEIHEVYVNVSGRDFTIIDVQVEREFEEETSVTKADLFSMYREAYAVKLQPDQRVYHVELQGFELDGEAFADAKGMMASHLKASYKVFVASKSFHRNIGLAVASSCFKKGRVVLDSISTAESVLYSDEKEAGVMLLEVGAELTKISLYVDGVLVYHDVLPYAGKVMTNDLKTECAITQAQAEKLKISFGRALTDKSYKNTYISIPSYNGLEPREINKDMLAAILQSRLEELAAMVKASGDESGYADRLRAGVVLVGGTAKLKNISTLLKFQFGLDVRLGLPRGVVSDIPVSRDPAFASTFGILMHGLYETQEELVEPIIEKRRKKKKESSAKKSNKLVTMIKEKWDVFEGKMEFFFSDDEGGEMKS